jgi:hypothetical protein
LEKVLISPPPIERPGVRRGVEKGRVLLGIVEFVGLLIVEENPELFSPVEDGLLENPG